MAPQDGFEPSTGWLTDILPVNYSCLFFNILHVSLCSHRDYELISLINLR